MRTLLSLSVCVCALAALGIAAAHGDTARGARAPRCHTSSLFLSLKSEGAGLGHQFFRVTLRNTSARTCSVKGYPGVSLLNARKHQIGRSATRERARVRRVTLRPSQAAGAKMQVASTGCGGRKSRFLRVIPPDETDDLIIRARISACNPSIQPLRKVTTEGAAARLARCHSGSLRLSLKKFNGAAGTQFALVVLRNKGRRACAIHGYPGVSLLGARKHQIGRSAKRAKGRSPRFRLRPGKAASAKFTATTGCSDGRSHISRYLRVYPPNERRALVVRARWPACNETIYPLQPGTRPPNQHR